MKVLKFFWLFGLISLVVISCKKEKDNVVIKTGTAGNESYFPMTVGNKWIYQVYKIDSSGNETTDSTMFDTIEVVKDTTINGLNYFKLKNDFWIYNLPYYSFLRDSSGNLVNEKGAIQFSQTIFTDSVYKFEARTNNELTYTIKGKMNNYPDPINVPVGNFTNNLVLNSRIDFYKSSYPSPKFKETIHAKGVGMVIDEFMFASVPIGEKFQKRLFSYQLK